MACVRSNSHTRITLQQLNTLLKPLHSSVAGFWAFIEEFVTQMEATCSFRR
jgi:hypothetical protein